jgi:hypothetical protein
MIISQSELFQKISAAVLHLKSKAADNMETAGTIAMLENTLNLLSATSIQLNIDEFPTDEADCLALINNAENGLDESDLEELKYLAQSLRWALDVVS